MKKMHVVLQIWFLLIDLLIHVFSFFMDYNFNSIPRLKPLWAVKFFSYCYYEFQQDPTAQLLYQFTHGNYSFF